MRITQVLSFLCILDTLWGFIIGNKRNGRHHSSAFQRTSNNNNNHYADGNNRMYFRGMAFSSIYFGANHHKKNSFQRNAKSLAVDSYEARYNNSAADISEATETIPSSVIRQTNVSFTDSPSTDGSSTNIRRRRGRPRKSAGAVEIEVGSVIPSKRSTKKASAFLSKARVSPDDDADNGEQQPINTTTVVDDRPASKSRPTSKKLSKTIQSSVILPSEETKRTTRAAITKQKPTTTTKQNAVAATRKWNTHFQELVDYKQHHGDCLVPHDKTLLGRWVARQRHLYHHEPEKMSAERMERLESIGFEWRVRKATWETRWNELVEYKKEHGDCLVPREHLPLGVWVVCQRRAYNVEPKAISEHRIEKLEAVGFEWDPEKAQWESRFKELVEYKKQHGDCLVPYWFSESRRLGFWVTLQRNLYSSEPRAISADRIQRLNDIGFVWDFHPTEWESRFQQLVDYKQEHGDCLVPTQFDTNPPLGVWVVEQRKFYHSKPRAISDERIQRLEDIGFEWDPYQALWDRKFEELLEYKQQHGDCLVQFDENPKLAIWVKNQRRYYNREPKGISADRIQRLNDIGFAWNRHSAQWELRFNQLLEYKQKYGDCLIPYMFQENPKLGEWVHQQRKAHNNGGATAISEERVEKLNGIGFEWDSQKAQWELYFKELVQYKQKYGDCLVPHSQKFEQLAGWVFRQRRLYKTAPGVGISYQRIQRLDAVGFVWDAKEQFEMRFSRKSRTRKSARL